MSYWLLVTILLGLLVVFIYAMAVYIAWRALFSDRPGDRRRCPRCWHDLSFTPGMTCGECGFHGKHERQFKRTRRRPVVAVGAIATCVALAGWIYWTLADGSWTSVVPTPVLLSSLPIVNDLNGWVYTEVTRRSTRNSFTSGQWCSIIDHAAAGDRRHALHTGAWLNKYGTLVSTCRQHLGRSDDDAWNDVITERLQTMPPYIELTTRMVWPTNETPIFRFDMHEWWPTIGDCRIRITPRLPGAESTMVQRTSQRRVWAGFTFPVAGLADDTTQVQFDITVEQHREPDDTAPPRRNNWQVMSRQVVTVPTRIGAVVLEAVQSAEHTDAVKRTFRSGVRRWDGGTHPVRVMFSPQDTHTSLFDDVALGAHVDIEYQGTLARRLDIWWVGGVGVLERAVGWKVAHEDLDIVRKLVDGSDDDGWTMTVSGDKEIALRAGDTGSYWKGTFTVPLRINHTDGTAPPPLWWNPDAPPTALKVAPPQN